MVQASKKPTAEQRVELKFLERLNERCVNQPDVLKALADLYTECGYYHKGLEVDLVLLRLLPEDNLVAYNLACSYALLQRIPEALDALEKAISLGYTEYAWMMKDSDLDHLREHPRFVALLERVAALA